MSVSILLVEDNEASLDARKSHIRALDDEAIVIGARDPDTAIHMLRSLPRFDLVIADIDLSETSKKATTHNKGGVAVAEWLRSTKYPAYVAGYSSYFLEGEMTALEKQSFNDFADKALDGPAVSEKYKSWILLSKGNNSVSLLQKLVYEACESQPIESRERPIRVVSLDTLVDYESDEVQEIRDNGYSLSLLLPDVDDEIRKAIPVWILRSESSVQIEVVGQPFLFAEGLTEAAAKEALRVLIIAYYNDLSEKKEDQEMGAYVRILFRFLESLFK